MVLEQIVAEAVGSLADFVRCYEPIFLYLLAKNNTAARQSEVQKLKQVIPPVNGASKQSIKPLKGCLKRISPEKSPMSVSQK